MHGRTWFWLGHHPLHPGEQQVRTPLLDESHAGSGNSEASLRHRDSFAAALVTCMEQGQEAEEDLFVCRACLQTLAVATPSTAARQLQGCFTLLAELSVFRGGAPLPSTPLVHFNTFLLEVPDMPPSPKPGLAPAAAAPSFSRPCCAYSPQRSSFRWYPVFAVADRRLCLVNRL